LVAHSDDDTTIGPVLSNLSKTNDVYQWIATDGRYGYHIISTSEDSLVSIRENEAKCSCEKLGINPLRQK